MELKVITQHFLEGLFWGFGFFMAFLFAFIPIITILSLLFRIANWIAGVPRREMYLKDLYRKAEEKRSEDKLERS